MNCSHKFKLSLADIYSKRVFIKTKMQSTISMSLMHKCILPTYKCIKHKYFNAYTTKH